MEYKDLPENFWEIVEKHLPNYSRRNDVMGCNILAKAVSEEEISKSDLKYLEYNFKGYDTDVLKKEFETQCIELYEEALLFSPLPMYPSAIITQEQFLKGCCLILTNVFVKGQSIEDCFRAIYDKYVK